jgi:hypothetical protein
MKNELLSSVLRAERPVKLALCVIVLAGCAGWALAASFAGYIGALRAETIAAQREAKSADDSVDIYKRIAAKAYTKMLIAQSHDSRGGLLIPAGTSVDCTMTYSEVGGKTIGKCEGPLLLPPRSFIN